MDDYTILNPNTNRSLSPDHDRVLAGVYDAALSRREEHHCSAAHVADELLSGASLTDWG